MVRKFPRCPKCNEETLPGAEEKRYACPKCDSVRVAQFGGVGGASQSSFQPGGSPIGRGGGSSGGSFNAPYLDIGLDGIISRTHHNAPIDEDRNAEKRLEIFHTQGDAEKSEIAYNLSLKERLRLKRKQHVHQHQENLRKSLDSVDHNSVHYIQDHFQPRTEHITSIEEALQSRRKYKPGIVRDPREDVSPEQLPPERVHPVMSLNHPKLRYAVKNNHTTTTVFGPQEDEYDDASVGDYGFAHEEDTPINPGNARWHTVPMGAESGPLTTQLELGSYLDEHATNNWGGGTGPNTETLAFGHPDYDSLGDHAVRPPDPIASPVQDGMKAAGEESAIDDPFQGMETQLESLKHPKTPSSLPHDPSLPNQDEAQETQEGIMSRYSPTGPEMSNAPSASMGRM